jgi:hypothetical protein
VHQRREHRPVNHTPPDDDKMEYTRHAVAWLVANYKSPSGVVVRASFGTLLGTGDLVSDVYAIATLLMLGHLAPAYALLAMVISSIAVQFRAKANAPLRQPDTAPPV